MQLPTFRPTGRSVVYARVSTSAQTEGLSIASQIERCRQRALSDGYEEIMVVEDAGVSGKSMARPGIERLLADIDEVSAIYVWSLSRLARNVRELLTLVDEVIVPREIRLVSVTEALDTGSPHGRFSLTVLGAVAQLQREQIVADSKRGIERRVRSGLWQGRPPYGYRLLPDKRGIEPHPNEAPVVGELFKRFAAGASLVALTQWLNSEGIPSQRNASWWHGTLADVLANPAYVGKLTFNDEVMPAKHERLVSTRVYNLVQERLADNRLIDPGRYGQSWSPLYRCGACGSTMFVKWGGARIDGLRYRNYICAASREVPVAMRHEVMAVSADKADAYLWRAVVTAIEGGALRRWVEEAQDRTTSETDQAAEASLREEAARLEADIAYAMRAARAGGITPEVLERENRPLLERLEQIRSRFGEIQRQRISRSRSARLLEIDAAAVRGALNTLSSEDRRLLLSRLTERVEVRGNHLTVLWSVPGSTPLSIPLPRYYSVKRGSGEV